MKKIRKSHIFSFILGALIFGSVGVIAANYSANEISFTPKNTNWKKEDGTDITNVKDALDNLYTKNSNITVSDEISRVNGVSEITINHSSLDYKYYIITTSQWSGGDYSTEFLKENISNITNATSLETGKGARARNKQSGGHHSYLIIPDGSKQDIVVTTTGPDNLSVYGIK